jgi:hypothetical protein
MAFRQTVVRSPDAHHPQGLPRAGLAISCLSLQQVPVAGIFADSEKVRLVGLKDARYLPGLVPNDRREEPVSPSESGTDRHAELLGRLPDGQTLLQALTVQKELFLRVKV